MGLEAWAGLTAAFAAVIVAIPAIPKEVKGRSYWLTGGLMLLLVAAGLGVAAMRETEDKPTTTGTAGGRPTTPAAPAADVTSVYLDSGKFPPESGSDRIVDVPRAIRGSKGYRTHPIAIRCPSNDSGDQSADVTFALHDRYRRFDATVHPYYPPTANQDSATHVAVSFVRGPGNSLTLGEPTRQNNATPADPQAITVDINDVNRITLKIQCGDPAGTVVLTDARLTPA